MENGTLAQPRHYMYMPVVVPVQPAVGLFILEALTTKYIHPSLVDVIGPLSYFLIANAIFRLGMLGQNLPLHMFEWQICK
eukprot:scaffold12214_cov33-Attheya_sp.AAC.1